MAKKRSAPAPAPSTIVRVPDFEINGHLNSLTTVNCSIAFDNQPNCNNYLLYYEEPVGTSTLAQVIDGVRYRQVSASYPASPIWVQFGWSPMYIGAIYKCRIACYFNDGTYGYSKPFEISTVL